MPARWYGLTSSRQMRTWVERCLPAAAPGAVGVQTAHDFPDSSGDGPPFRYAGQPVHVLAGHEDRPAGFAAMEITVPAHFAGPLPHARDGFDEAIHVLRVRLLAAGDDEPQEAAAGSMFVAPRGQRHGFSNPHDADALVLGIWAPAGPAIGGEDVGGDAGQVKLEPLDPESSRAGLGELVPDIVKIAVVTSTRRSPARSQAPPLNTPPPHPPTGKMSPGQPSPRRLSGRKPPPR